jgi:outer membrane protein
MKYRTFLPLALSLSAAALTSAQPLLTLSDALKQALGNNRNYRIAEADARSAANKVGWGEAGALPKVDVNAAYSHSINDTRQELSNGTATDKSGAGSSATTAGVAGTWTVFSGLTSLAAHTRLETQARIADLQREGTRQDLASDVITAYGDVVRQQALLAALDTAVSLSKERVKLTEGKYGLGSVSKLELLQAKLDLNDDISARLHQAQALGNSKRFLNLLLAWPDTAAFSVADSIPLAPLPPIDGLRGAALNGSPSVLQAEQNRRLAQAGLREYVGGLFPKIDLNLGYNYGLSESEAGFILSNRALGWTYGATLKFNIFDGFALPGDYHLARKQIYKAELLTQEARARAESGLAEAYAAYRSSLDVLQLEASNLELARENVGIAMQRLRLGTIASLELRTAQEKFVSAETRLVSARFDSKRAETELLRLAGRLPDGSAVP